MIHLINENNVNMPKWVKEATWYFENIHGEEWVAKLDGRSIVITGRDIDWKEIYIDVDEAKEYADVKLGVKRSTKKFKENALNKWVFSEEEEFWLISVIVAARQRVKFLESTVELKIISLY